jgi:sugar-specific transcriptional regulator TrmB
MTDTINSLQKLGLSEKESKVYLACLELGDSSASDISLKSHLPRTLVYDILERLITLGLVSYAIKDNKKHFWAAEPKEFKRMLQEKENALNEVMPQLEAIQKAKGVKRPRVEIYEGVEGMKTAMSNIINSGVKEFYAYGGSGKGREIMPAFMTEWHRIRLRNKMLLKIIYNDTEEIRESIVKDKEVLKAMEYRFAPIKVASPGAIIIYANKMVLRSWDKEPFAVVIESDEMIKNQKKYFEELWKISKE